MFWQREAFHRERLTFFRVFIQVYLNCVHASCSLVRLLSIRRPAVGRKSYEIFGIMTQLNKQTRLGIVETGQVGDVSNQERKVAKLSRFINL